MGAVVIPQPNFLQSLLTAQQAVGGLQEIQQRAQQQRQLEALRQRLQSQQNLPTVLAQLATVSPQAAAQAREGLNLPFQQQGMQQQALLDAARAQNQLREFGAPLTREGRLVFESGFTSPEEFQAELRRRQTALEAGRNRPLVQILPDGTLAPTRATQNLAQKNLTEFAALDSGMKAINELGDISKLLTVPGRVATTVAKGLDFLGLPLKGAQERVKLQQRARSRTARVANELRVQVTGAAAPEQELKRIMADNISLDMTPSQFEAAREELDIWVAKMIRMNLKIASEGFAPASKQGKKRLDELWRTDPGLQPDEIEPFFNAVFENRLKSLRQSSPNATEDELIEQAEDFAYDRLDAARMGTTQ